MKQSLGSMLFNGIWMASVVVWALVVCLATPFGRTFQHHLVRVWVGFVFTMARWFCGLTYSVEGRENIPEQPGVAYLKHSSTLETFAELEIFPKQTWVLKRELMWVPFFGWALMVLNPIAINRSAGKSAVEQVVEQGKDRLSRGLWVMIFPEGTRMPAGETRRYGISGALLASRTGCPLVPVAHDAGDYWPRRGWLKKPGVVRFVIGKPIETEGRDPRDINEEAQAWIEGKVEELRRAAGN